ncbi:hypothetical protein OIU35_10490 [Boseaceae bacterium BT-24-1]|nr:hypothetical protein [Boseaceae bacterium BT-24-1]
MGNLKLRWYVPENATKESNLPIIVFFRGGGWVIADLDVYDATPSALARLRRSLPLLSFPAPSP